MAIGDFECAKSDRLLVAHDQAGPAFEHGIAFAVAASSPTLARKLTRSLGIRTWRLVGDVRNHPRLQQEQSALSLQSSRISQTSDQSAEADRATEGINRFGVGRIEI
jgi:hypothetical protein